MFDKAHTHDIFFFLVVRFKSSTTSMTKLGQSASGDLDETSDPLISSISFPMKWPWQPQYQRDGIPQISSSVVKISSRKFSRDLIQTFQIFFFFKCSEKYPFNWGFFFPMESIKWIKPVNYVRPTTFHLYTLEYGHMSRIGQVFISQRVR